MKTFNYFLILSIFVSCAQMKKNWIAENCNEGSAYSAGVSDAQNGMNHNANSFGMCEQDKIGPLKKEYSKGYNSVKSQESKVVVKEIHHESHNHGRPQTTGIITSKTDNGPVFYECSVDAYGNTFVSSDHSEKMARKNALAKCESKYNLLNCRSTGCRLINNKTSNIEYKQPKKFHCKIRAYSNTFSGFDYNLGKARYHAINKCKRVYNETHCKNPECIQEI